MLLHVHLHRQQVNLRYVEGKSLFPIRAWQGAEQSGSRLRLFHESASHIRRLTDGWRANSAHGAAFKATLPTRAVAHVRRGPARA